MALYAEHGLSKSKLLPCDLFHSCMQANSPFSFSYLANTNQTPIDSIWVSANVTTVRSDYCPFDGTVGMKSDHRLLWIEVCNISILGKPLPASVSVPASRVRSDDPRSCNQYICKVQEAYQSAKVLQFVVNLKSLVKNFESGDVSVSKYESLHKLTTDIRFRVEHSLHSRYVGGVPWPPQLQKFRDHIEFWTCVVKL